MSGAVRTFVVVNPRSAAGATGRRWKHIADAIRCAIGTFETGVTEGPEHATDLTRGALASGFQRIVAVGGDGTLNEVACGFFGGRWPLRPDAILGVVPHGTGCDFVRSLGVERGVGAACARLARARVRTIDVGIARFAGHGGEDRQRIFVNAASFGCGGEVAAAIARGPKWLGGKLAFTLTSAATLLRHRDQEVAVSINDGPLETLNLTSFAVCNGEYFGGGMRVAPHAVVDDGRFAITVWSDITFKDFVLLRRSLYDGTHVKNPKTRVYAARKIAVTAKDRVLLEVDGEPVGTLPATLEILAASLNVTV